MAWHCFSDRVADDQRLREKPAARHHAQLRRVRRPSSAKREQWDDPGGNRIEGFWNYKSGFLELAQALCDCPQYLLYALHSK
jgi:hypothetical protein